MKNGVKAHDKKVSREDRELMKKQEKLAGLRRKGVNKWDPQYR